MFNKVILIGNLTRDIELRYLPSGQAVAKTGIASNRRYKDGGGNQKEETMFIDLTIWGRAAEIANQYTRRGSRVMVEGRLTLEQWTDQNGQKRSKHSVTVESLKMLDRKGEGEGHGGQAPSPQGGYGQQATAAAVPAPQSAPPRPSESADRPAPQLPEIDIDEEDIPF